MIRKLGFFHFGNKNKADPIGQLRHLLDVERLKGCNFGESLLVLPEAFNIGRGYRSAGSPDYDPRVVGRLQQLSREFQGMGFVVGLIVHSPTNHVRIMPPRSAAFLIDQDLSVLLSYKMGADDQAGTLYQTCVENCTRTFQYKGRSTGALICMDAGLDQNAKPQDLQRARDRHDWIRTQLSDADSILCVPAHMGMNPPAEKIAELWPMQHFVAANSNGAGCASVLSLAGDKAITDRAFGDQNRLVLRFVP